MGMWEKALEAAEVTLLRELVHSLKAAEAEEICRQGGAAIARYALAGADLLDVLCFLEIDGRRAVLWRGGEQVMEGELLDIAVHVEEHPHPDYRLELIGEAVASRRGSG